MLNIFLGMFGMTLGFFLGLQMLFNKLFSPNDKFWGCLLVSVLIATDFVYLVASLKTYFNS